MSIPAPFHFGRNWLSYFLPRSWNSPLSPKPLKNCLPLNMPVLAHTRHILLADDDKDDLGLFGEILEELPFAIELTVVHNGEQLMQFLNEKKDKLPDVLFLDLNMPRKNGFDCLTELKKDEKLKMLPVIIFTTSNEPSVINLLYKTGAHYYIRKPNNVVQLKVLIELALTLTAQPMVPQPPREKFVLTPLQPANKENK
jgi:CheY-like chemotaxis protein